MWSRNFALFFVARAVARLGDTMLPVALAAAAMCLAVPISLLSVPAIRNLIRVDALPGRAGAGVGERRPCPEATG
ncbi:hypothetical protein ACFY1U_13180 [Streptomyces sp. NPDC001351]|uniref:hypothetical protein n=1 Tax=Streptomyces sp. NPDC001351 TaxID=3364564 RepID=UPI003697E897